MCNSLIVGEDSQVSSSASMVLMFASQNVHFFGVVVVGMPPGGGVEAPSGISHFSIMHKNEIPKIHINSLIANLNHC